MVQVLLLIYLGVVLVFFAFQTRLIFPGLISQGQPWAVVRPGPDAELVTLRTAGGDRVVALFGPALSPEGRPLADAAARPTLLYFYGNGSCLRHALDEFETFRRLGANVLIPDYTGYGMSGGRAGEAGCVATADAAYDHLRARPDVDPDRIVVVGWSLGAAVAIDLAARRPVAGLVTLSAFTSMLDMAHTLYPWLPARLLLRHRFESERKIASVTAPTLIIHGRRDGIIAYTMSDRLAAAAGGPVTRLAIDDGDHNDLFAISGEEIPETLRRFLAGVPSTSVRGRDDPRPGG
jgi:fermentation-respiration switch protein FrsA (DUF1100 family)